MEENAGKQKDDSSFSENIPVEKSFIMVRHEAITYKQKGIQGNDPEKLFTACQNDNGYQKTQHRDTYHQ